MFISIAIFFVMACIATCMTFLILWLILAMVMVPETFSLGMMITFIFVFCSVMACIIFATQKLAVFCLAELAQCKRKREEMKSITSNNKNLVQGEYHPIMRIKLLFFR